jgi:serine/threonine protein kinase
MAEEFPEGGLLQSRYRMQAVLARTGMNTVYKALDTVSSSMVVIKEMKHHGEKSRETVDILRKEYTILRGLAHPGIPQVHNYFEIRDCSYLVEEYIEGVTLRDLISTIEPSDLSRMMSIVFQLCAILHFLNRKGVIYRDLKPANIVINVKGIARLVDFGAARLYRKGKKQDTLLLGTPGFASPEHYGYGQTDERSDVFSIGAVLYYLFTRINPGDEPFIFQDPSSCNPIVCAELSSIILKATSLKPRERYATIREFRKALYQAVQKFRCGSRLLFCPICWEEMRILQSGHLEVDECRQCGGIWCDREELDELTSLDEEVLSSSLEKYRSNQPDEATGSSDPGRLIHCPVCTERMKAFQHSKKPLIMLDRCREGCGTWLDGGEIRTIKDRIKQIAGAEPGEESGIAGLLRFFGNLYERK